MIHSNFRCLTASLLKDSHLNVVLLGANIGFPFRLSSYIGKTRTRSFSSPHTHTLRTKPPDDACFVCESHALVLVGKRACRARKQQPSKEEEKQERGKKREQQASVAAANARGRLKCCAVPPRANRKCLSPLFPFHPRSRVVTTSFRLAACAGRFSAVVVAFAFSHVVFVADG